MKYYIDRFEEDFAVCYAENRIDKLVLPLNSLPENAEEGDFICIEDDIITLDKSETEERKSRISSLMEDLFD